MPFTFVNIALTEAVWIFDPTEMNSLFIDTPLETKIIGGIHSLTIMTDPDRVPTPIQLPTLVRFTKLMSVTIRNANINKLTDLGTGSVWILALQNTQIETLDNIDTTNLTQLSIINNPKLLISHLPVNLTALIVKDQVLGDIYLTPRLLHVSFGGTTSIQFIYNLKQTRLVEMYFGDKCTHPYDFDIPVLHYEDGLDWLTRVVGSRNRQHHYESYLSLGSIRDKIILPDNPEENPIIKFFGLSSNYPRRMAEFVVNTDVV